MKTLTFILIVGLGLICIHVMMPLAYAHHEKVVINIPLHSDYIDCAYHKSCYNPYVLTIKANRTVEWQNRDVVSHTVTSGSSLDSNSGSLFESGLIKPKHSFLFTFERVGKYNYFCEVHPWQIGVINVKK